MPIINQIRVDGQLYDIEGIVGKKDQDGVGEIFGDYSSNRATGSNSHAEGTGTIANNPSEHAEGKYNKSNSNTIHSVGIGTSDIDRKNAFEITDDGSIYMNGIGGYTGTTTAGVKPINEVINGIEAGEGVVAESIGVETVGSETNPIYLNLGKPAASNATIGGEKTPIWMEGGTFKPCSDDISSALEAIKTDGDGTLYLADDGTYKPVAASGTVEVANKLGTSNVGSNVKHMYLEAGTPRESNQTVGSSSKPVYMNNGSITECGETLNVSINGNASTANYIPRDRDSNIVSTLVNLPVNKSTIYANLNGATNISLSSNMNVGESITIFCMPSSDFTQPIPDTGSFISMDGSTLSIKNGKMFEINIYCYTSNKYSISCKIKK